MKSAAKIASYRINKAKSNNLDFHVYSISPIDFGREHCTTAEEYYAALAMEDLHGHTRPDVLKRFESDFKKAKDLGSEKGWEGDIWGEANVFMIPDENELTYGFARKQETNGTTNVVSPVAVSPKATA